MKEELGTISIQKFSTSTVEQINLELEKLLLSADDNDTEYKNRAISQLRSNPLAFFEDKLRTERKSLELLKDKDYGTPKQIANSEKGIEITEEVIADIKELKEKVLSAQNLEEFFSAIRLVEFIPSSKGEIPSVYIVNTIKEIKQTIAESPIKSKKDLARLLGRRRITNNFGIRDKAVELLWPTISELEETRRDPEGLRDFRRTELTETERLSDAAGLAASGAPVTKKVTEPETATGLGVDREKTEEARALQKTREEVTVKATPVTTPDSVSALKSEEFWTRAGISEQTPPTPDTVVEPEAVRPAPVLSQQLRGPRINLLKEENRKAKPINVGKKLAKDLGGKMVSGLKKLVTKEAPTTPKTSQEQVADFVAKFDLESLLPAEFGRLEEAQKLKVIQDLKRRIVDIVKSDAQTQYSEGLKEKPLAKSVVNSIVFSPVVNSIFRETDLKDLEKKVFEKLKDSFEGRELIRKDLEIICKRVSAQKVEQNSTGEAFVFYLDNELHTPEEATFNSKANEFAKIPYEWGQEGGGKHKKVYGKARAEYQKAREELLRIAGTKSPEERERTLLTLLEADNAVLMEQLLNTHPEFEEALDDFGKSAGGKEIIKTGWNFLQTLTGGKNTTNKLIAAGGFGARMLARGAAVTSGTTIITAIAAPIIGGAVGGLRGRIRANETLDEKLKGARHGKKDESKEAANTVSAENLSKRLEDLIRAYEQEPTMWFRGGDQEGEVLLADGKAVDRKESKLVSHNRIDQLKRRIEFTRSKIEAGLVDFGDAKKALNNQYKLIENLNRALVIGATLEDTTRKDIDARLEQFLSYKHDNIIAAQNAFIKKQMWKGVAMGAGFATAGYTLRYVGEHLGWWGENGAGGVTKKIETPGSGSHGSLDKSIKLTSSHGGEQEKIELVSSHDHTTPKVDTVKLVASHGKDETEILSPSETTAPAITFTEQSIKFEHGTGGIQGVIDLRAQIKGRYPDLSKAPQSVQDFMKEPNATKLAIKLGLFQPGTEDGKESALIGEGSVLKFDEHGNLSLHNTLNGKENTLIHGNSAEVEKYHGNMFDSDHSAQVHIEPSPDEQIVKIPEGAKSYPIDHPANPEVAAARAKVLVGMEEAASKQQAGSTAAETAQAEHVTTAKPGRVNMLEEYKNIRKGNSHFAKNPFDLTPANLVDAYETHQRNIKFLFPEDKIGDWEALKKLKAKDWVQGGAISDDFDPFTKYLNKLSNATGLDPRGWRLFGGYETNESYIERALQKAASLRKLGRLDLKELQ